jgi:hypothetical protein
MFYEIQYGRHANESDLADILFNPVASTTAKWRAFKFLRWIEKLKQSTWFHETLYAELEDEHLLIRPFLQQKCRKVQDG